LNFTRQITTQTANAATGIHIISLTSVASCSASATPPISAVNVIRLMKNDAPRFAAAVRGPRRSRHAVAIGWALSQQQAESDDEGRQQRNRPKVLQAFGRLRHRGSLSRGASHPR
jgi:hypothetical protein